jgi:hypothetical protein
MRWIFKQIYLKFNVMVFLSCLAPGFRKGNDLLVEFIPTTSLEICLDRIKRFKDNSHFSCTYNLNTRDITKT